MRRYTRLTQAHTLIRRLAMAGPGVILAMLIIHGSVLSIRPAFAVPGDLLGRVALPEPARCPDEPQIALALVPGSVFGFNDRPTLLVTSCLTREPRALHFWDPTTNPATLVRTITTDLTPPEGWIQLALRGSSQLLGCSQISRFERVDGQLVQISTDRIYTIDIDPSNSVRDGTTRFLFQRPFGGLCAIAWDPQDDTILRAPQAALDIERLGLDGRLLGSIRGCQFSASIDGLTIPPFGDSLFVSCGGTAIFQINIMSGRLVRRFTVSTNLSRLAFGLACDSATFVNSPREARHRDAIWAQGLGSETDQLTAFELPLGTCTAGRFRCPDGDTTDTDEDGLLDCWERDGIDGDGDGTIDFVLDGADPNHRDIYVEIDYMALHRPTQRAIDAVVDAFAAPPVSNPDRTRGIRLHIQVDEEALPHSNDFAWPSATPLPRPGVPDFDTTKRAHFGTAAERDRDPDRANVLRAKHLAFHYALFVHNFQDRPDSAGFGGMAQRNLVVGLGSIGPADATGHRAGHADQQASVFMHELGHNLDLQHGGGDVITCKPNHLSVMNYSHTWEGAPIIGRPLDYSRTDFGVLNEVTLNETVGIGPARNAIGNPELSGRRTAFGPLTFGFPTVAPPDAEPVLTSQGWVVVTPADQPIDWNKNNDTADEDVQANINDFASSACNGSGTRLQGFNDWANLQYNFRVFADPAFPAATEGDEPEPVFPRDERLIEFAEDLSVDTDEDGVLHIYDNCPFVANPGQEDRDGDGIGDACEAGPAAVSLTPATAVNPLGTAHTVTATVLDGRGNPVVGETVEFQVRGGNTASGSATTNESGEATFTYIGTAIQDDGTPAGDDTITAWVDLNEDGEPDPTEPQDVATKSWVLGD